MIISRIILSLLISVFGGTFLLYFLKKSLVDEKLAFSFDLSGMLERFFITLLFFGPTPLILLLPLIVGIKAFHILQLKKLSSLVRREEPSLSYQKVKIKSLLGIDLLLSPLLAILVGMVAKGL